MFDTRLATLSDQTDQHAHDHHQLVMAMDVLVGLVGQRGESGIEHGAG